MWWLVTERAMFVWGFYVVSRYMLQSIEIWKWKQNLYRIYKESSSMSILSTSSLTISLSIIFAFSLDCPPIPIASGGSQECRSRS